LWAQNGQIKNSQRLEAPVAGNAMAIIPRVNGVGRSTPAEPDTPLRDLLRNDLESSRAKVGCGYSQCGARRSALSSPDRRLLQPTFARYRRGMLRLVRRRNRQRLRHAAAKQLRELPFRPDLEKPRSSSAVCIASS
jgi:hypothetical protein